MISLAPHSPPCVTSRSSPRTAVIMRDPTPTNPPASSGALYPIKAARTYIRDRVRVVAQTHVRPLRLVGVLASDDVGSGIYAKSNAKVCSEIGVEYETLNVRGSVDDVKDAVRRLCEDVAVDGVIFYTPAFTPEDDEEIRACITPRVDVEGLGSELYDSALHAIVDWKPHRDAVLAPTALAVVRALQFADVYNHSAVPGSRLRGKVAVIINRSRTVGLPLAHLFANDGALVYSVDVDSIMTCSRPRGEGHIWRATQRTLNDVLSNAHIVVSAVPSAGYAVPLEHIRPGAATVNVASPYDNFVKDGQTQEAVLERVGWHLPKMGSLTILCLIGNLATLRQRTAT